MCLSREADPEVCARVLGGGGLGVEEVTDIVQSDSFNTVRSSRGGAVNTARCVEQSITGQVSHLLPPPLPLRPCWSAVW